MVELLVVIGIIALLISILLPGLNKARQQANLVACASQLKQIGNLVQLYATNNRGVIVPASITYTATGQNGWPNPGPNGGGTNVNPDANRHGTSPGPVTFWYDQLTLLANKRTMQDAFGTTGQPPASFRPDPVYTYDLANCGLMCADVLPIFHDKDVPSDTWCGRTSSYIANMRIIAPANARDRAAASWGANGAGPGWKFNATRKIGDIRASAEAMMVWCAPVALYNDANMIQQYDSASWNLDGAAYDNGHYFVKPIPQFGKTSVMTTDAAYGNRIGLTNMGGDGTSYGTPPTNAQLKQHNRDNDAPTANAMRFRHMGDKALNALFADGHVESRPIGEVRARDICVNYK